MAAISAGWLSLPPKPPPIRRTSTVDGIVRQAEHLGDGVLDLGRMLRRGMDKHVAALARNGIGDLSFEVEMVLPADMHRAGDPVAARRRAPRPRRRAAISCGGQEIGVGGQRFLDD